MTRKRKHRSDEELIAASEHLLYEISMLFDTAHALMMLGPPKDKQETVIRNALLESFAVHARNLIDFFFQDKPRSDQIVAEDFLDDEEWSKQRPAISPQLKSNRVGVHQKVAHLSYARVHLTPEQRSWRWTDIATEIGKTIKVFCDLVPDSKVSDSFRKIVFHPIDEVLADIHRR